ncbi:hypothetical protein LU276_06545 [Moraxella haemolytica]|uniref:hypothetical protein n=1 Tax=Moraxella haemolytica TaxID=2904119 RepID=UPI00254331DB|nr:hypothetical protein [Moraxella sp. ZY171148]WII94683.1 hypothetical protein LU276_06545 [Moraxella sp. ZY171148]
MRVYLNPATDQTAVINSDKADKDGKIWVEINNALPTKMSYDEFITKFTSIGELKS